VVAVTERYYLYRHACMYKIDVIIKGDVAGWVEGEEKGRKNHSPDFIRTCYNVLRKHTREQVG
jgi:hypothetical protein